MGCQALLQGIFPTQGWNPDLPHCTWILYDLSHQEDIQKNNKHQASRWRKGHEKELCTQEVALCVSSEAIARVWTHVLTCISLALSTDRTKEGLGGFDVVGGEEGVLGWGGRGRGHLGGSGGYGLRDFD